MNTFHSDIGDLLRNNQSFIVLSHIRPDGDAYGTALGLAHILIAMGKQVKVYNEDGLNSSYSFLPGSNLVQSTPTEPPAANDILIAVDTAAIERLGDAFLSWKRIPDLNIDHHISNNKYGKLNHVDAEAPASAEIIYLLARHFQFPCPKAAAENLFVGLSTDTGSFRHRQTTARTFEVASSLTLAGADPTELAQKCYQNYRPNRLLLVREALNNTLFTMNNRVAYYHLTRAMFAKTGALREETEGMLEYIQMVGSVEVAFVLEEVSDHVTRASLRSRGGVDVNAIAQQFGGGGHRLAAGIRTESTLAEFEPRLLAAIQVALDQEKGNL